MLLASVPMKINSEKKHSVRYDAVLPDAAIQSVYIMKTAFPNKIPQTVTLTIQMDNE